MANSLRAALPKKGAAQRQPLPPKNGVTRLRFGEDESAAPEHDDSEMPQSSATVGQNSETTAETAEATVEVVGLRYGSASADEVSPQPIGPGSSSKPSRRRQAPSPPVAAVPVVPSQLQLDAAADAFLRDVEVEGIRMGKRLINRSSAARFAIAQLIEKMSPQEVADALLRQSDGSAQTTGRGRKRL